MPNPNPMMATSEKAAMSFVVRRRFLIMFIAP
jgi:hypothetical protein